MTFPTAAGQRVADRDQGAVAVVVLVVPILFLAMFLLLIGGVVATQSAAGDCADEETGLAAAPRVADLSREQMRNAEIIVQTAADLRLPSTAARIAIAVALQESDLRNLRGGDRDSAGLFQQRAAWGSLAVRTTPRASATMFYTGGQGGQPGLDDIDGWQQMPLTVAAQAVQRSAFPDAYGKWTGSATAIVRELWGTAIGKGSGLSTTPGGIASVCDDGDARTGSTTVPSGLVVDGSPSAQNAVRFALAQLGKPYRWAAAGPDAYDCSGLTMAAWASAGEALPHFTGAQARSGTRVAGLVRAETGDLVFIPGLHGSIAEPRHVGMVVGYVPAGRTRQLWIIHAPRTGQSVELVSAAQWHNKIAAVRHVR